MAIIESPVWSRINKSLGGITYFNGPGHPILARIKNMPTNPNTPAQQLTRQAMAQSVYLWDAMSNADRAAWNVYATTLTPFRGGRATFIANHGFAYSMNARGISAITPGDAPPVMAGNFEITNIGYQPLIAIGLGFNLTWTNNTLLDAVAVWQITGLKSNARNFFKGPFPASSLNSVAAPASSSVTHSISPLPATGIYFVKLRFCTEEEPIVISSLSILRCVANEILV